MIYKLSHYRHLKNAVEYQTKINPKYTIDDILSNAAINTMAPIVVIGHLLIELGHDSLELQEKLRKLKEFYKVEVDTSI